MKLLLDTNAYIDWRRTKKWNDLISRSPQILFPTIVLGELYAGFRIGTSGRENLAKLSIFLSMDPVTIITPTAVTAEIYGELVAQLRRQGSPIPTNDLWIGALAYEWKAVLVTGDSHFQNLPQIVLAQPSP